MRRRILGSILTLLCMTYLTSGVAFAASKTLSLSSLKGESTIAAKEGEVVKVEVRVDDASEIAGASFTVAYDTANLSLTSVASSFFGTFVNQSIPTPTNGYIIIDGVKYTRPLTINKNVSGLSGAIPTGSMLAAARVDNGSGANARLFVLNFTLTGMPGTYPIAIKESIISNTDAGYSASGEAIPYLVGIGSGGTYIAHSVPTINNASIVISIVDTDGDEISDLWETDNAPLNSTDPLAVFSKTGDYDKDGYSDYVEYMNRFIPDPLGNPFNPTVRNAPGGEGYIEPVADAAGILPAMLLMLDLNKTNQ